MFDTILLQICQNFIREVAEFFIEGDGPKTIAEMEVNLKEKADNFIVEIVEAYLEELDKSIVDDKASRRQEGIVIERRKDKRELYTQFGQIVFSRTYFHAQRNDEHVYLLDKAVGIERYERVSTAVTQRLIECASENSYGKSSKYVTKGEVSRQTVMNKLRKVKKLKIDLPTEKRQASVLYINADEDHASMQGGKNSIVPLISIHEGIERQGKRGSCINTHYISSSGKDNEDLWLEAAEWIYEAYEAEKIEHIYLHGDGAAWIKEGLKWLPNTKLVLDRYHLNKAIMTATSQHPEARTAIYTALSNSDKEAFRAIIKGLYQKAGSVSEKEKIRKFHRYITNNWEAIVIYNHEECGSSCTEGHVSHILSSRISSRPMGWSPKGLQTMAELRAFIGSGGKIEPKHFRDTSSKYRFNQSMTAKMTRAYVKVSNEKFANIPILKRGKVVPMFPCLRGLQDGNIRL
ncbi:MAG: ISLre2 family transposase [bacterium]